MKLIDKDALVAEIERKRSIAAGWDISSTGVNDTEFELWNDFLSFLDTLEVKEVDFEREMQAFAKINLEPLVISDSNIGISITMSQLYNCARHFFELGLKAQHDNWKVVDDINPPQADKNKIYCVFTKQQYILAKVINHPQDEDLLQWKCTEFPFHRYDMCEGDKYMQIV